MCPNLFFEGAHLALHEVNNVLELQNCVQYFLSRLYFSSWFVCMLRHAWKVELNFSTSAVFSVSGHNE
jgi:hypothetical protein